MECGRSIDIDISKVYSESLNFMVQEHQRFRGMSKSPLSNEKDFSKIGMVGDGISDRRSNSPTCPGFESVQFKNDVMFSSASMSETTEGCATFSNNVNKSLINSGDSIVFSDRQSSSTDLSVADIKTEHVSSEEDGLDTCFQTSSRAVYPEMTPSVKNSGEIEICSEKPESFQDNVDFVIKQEPLTDDEDDGKDVFGKYWSNEMDDKTNSSVTQQMDEPIKKRQMSDMDIDNSKNKRAKRNITGKTYKKFGNEFYMGEVGDLEEDSNPNQIEETKVNTDEEYTPSIYIDHKTNNKVAGQTEIGRKGSSNIMFSFENLEGNTLNIKGTSKSLQVKIFKCPECSDIFTYESVFKKHMKRHTGDMPFKCKHCDLGFMTQFSHDLHSRVHSTDKSYLCGVCGEKIKMKKDLKEHIQNHTKNAHEVSPTPPIKTERTTTTESGEKESSYDAGFSPFGCSMCVFVAKDFAEIGNHVMESHFVDKRCFCDICSRRFASADDLKLHKSLHDDQCEEIICGICDEIVDNREDLMKHLDIHPEAKPYRCGHCGDKFIVLPQLQSHMQTHPFTKRYNCPYCFKQFFHEDTLESHLRVHTGEISYICPICDKGFRVSDRLKRHMKEHKTPYSLYDNYRRETINNNMDSSNEHREEALKHGWVEENTINIQESITDNKITSEYLSSEWKGEPSCNDDASVSDSLKSSEPINIKQEVNIGEEDNEEERQMYRTDSRCMDNLYKPSEETVDSSPGSVVIENLMTQSSFTGSQVPLYKASEEPVDSSSGTDTIEDLIKHTSFTGSKEPSSGDANSGTSFCFSVKKLTKVPVTDKFNNMYPGTKDTNTNQKFAEMERTMKLQMNVYQCNICGAMFAYNNMLKRHMMKHAGKEPYKCLICGHGCMSSSALKAHSLVHSGEKPFRCEKCPKAFRQKSSLKTHLLSHKVAFQQSSCGVDAFGCNICDLTFVDMSAVFSHVNTYHFDKQIHVCDVCCQRFDTLLSLQVHQTTHIDCQIYTCAICHEHYTDKEQLNTHLDDHPTAKPFRCQICCQKFCSVTQFTMHMESHAIDRSEKAVGESSTPVSPEAIKPTEADALDRSGKRFPCRYCDQAFSTASQRRVHSVVHEEARPYSCSICGKRYINKGSLDSHEKAHTNGERKRGKKNSLKDLMSVVIRKTKISTKPKSTKQNAEEKIDISDMTHGNIEPLPLKEESDGIAGEMLVSESLNPSNEYVSPAHEKYNNEYSFIKTEPISTGYCDTETTNGGGDLPFPATETTVDEDMQGNQDMLLTADTLYGHQMEIKNEPGMEEFDEIQQTFTDNTCGNKYTNQNDLETHETSHGASYSARVEWMCTECGAEFRKKCDLRKHIRRNHNETNIPSFKSKLKKVKMKECMDRNSKYNETDNIGQ